MGGMVDGHAEDVGDGGVEVDRGGQRVDIPGRRAGPADQQRDVAQVAVDGRRRLAEQVVLAEIVAVVGAQDHHGVVAARPASSMASSSRPNQWSIMDSLEP